VATMKNANWRISKMKIGLRVLIATVCLAFVVLSAEDLTSAIRGIVTKVDSAAKIIVVKTKDGSEHSIHYVNQTVVRGVNASEAASKDSYKGIKEGADVVVHYTKKDSVDTADEVDKLSKDSLKTIDGTVSSVSKDGKKVTIKLANGTEKTFDSAGKGAQWAAQSMQTDAKVTVSYTEKAGRDIAHWFE
jgi:hypothetical protein